MVRPGLRISVFFGLLLAALLLLTVLSAVAHAADYYGNSATVPYVYQYYFDNKATNRFSLYENANIHAEKFGVTGLSLHFGGWGRWDATGKDDPDQKQPGDADLGYAYLQWQSPEGMLNAILGRHYVAAGTTAESIDGLDVALTPVTGLTFRAFGGVPAYSRVGDRTGDYGGGARISYAYRQYFEIGASGNYFYEDSQLDRNNVGGDIYIAPVRYVDLIGHVFADTVFPKVYDAAGILTIYPTKEMRLQGGFSHIVPAAFISKASFFSVFSADKIDKYNGEASYLIANRVRILGGYSHYVYDTAHPADRGGGGAELLWGKAREDSLGAQFYRLSKKGNGYNELHGYLFERFTKVFYVAANSTTYLLENKIYNVGTAFDGDLSLGVDVTKHLNIQATGVYRATPYYNSDYRGLLKIGYNVERAF